MMIYGLLMKNLLKKLNTVQRPPARFPELPEKDLLLFIMNHSRNLEDWHQDILTILREEMLLFLAAIGDQNHE